MRSTRTKVIAAIVAVAVVAAGAFAFVQRGGSQPTRASRPERPLGPGGDSGAVGTDPDLASSTGEPAVPVTGAVAQPHKARPSLRRPTVAPWVKRELTLATTTDPDASTKPALAPDHATTLNEADGAEQSTPVRNPAMPAADINAEGQKVQDNGSARFVPPDTNGDVGTTQYVQMVNTVWSVYDKTDGSKISGPFTLSSLFDAGTQKLCATHDDGDPVVVWDPIANRWLMSQFALNFSKNVYAECVAVSTSADATSTWNAYQFNYPKANTFPDYPKFGVWPDGYYASFNQFKVSSGGSFSWGGAGAVAYDRADMLTGAPASQIYFNLAKTDINLGGMLPSDLDGATQPGVGDPNVYAQVDANEWGYPKDQIELWAFHTDWTTPANSTFTSIASNLNGDAIPTKAFNPWICGAGKTYCIPQKGSPVKLDTLLDRVMFRLQYRNFGTSQTLTLSHSVRSSSKTAGVRWYVLRDSGSGYVIQDQGTFAPNDGRYRWMGSAALDSAGNLAVGYSISSGKMYPSIAYAGKLAADMGTDPGNLTQGEKRVFNGTGSEKGQYGRWGDYSDMTVDPANDCTFYYTQQYYGKTGQWGWRTRIVAFTYPSC